MSKYSYWEKRQAQWMFEYMESAEKAADEIAALYQKSVIYLDTSIDDIFDKYRTKYHLTEEEAAKLLQNLPEDDTIRELKKILEKDKQNKKKQELLKEIESPAYESRIRRLEHLRTQIDDIMENIYQQEHKASISHYINLASEAYYKSIFDMQQRTGYGHSFSFVSPRMIDRIINSKWSGENYSTRIWRNTRMLAETVKEELLLGLLTGKTNREAAKDIELKFAVGASKARRLIRTESNYLCGQIAMESYKAAGIEKYRFLATLDLRTSEVCRSLDGKIFLVAEQEPGKNCNPMHPWCRSTTISIIDDEVLSKFKRTAFDPDTGKTVKVPANMTYEQWYRKFVADNPKAQSMEKMVRNMYSDRKQWENYQDVIGDRAGKNLEEFQEIKYNNSERWQQIRLRYKDTKLGEKLKSDKTIKKIKTGQQSKHIIGSNNYTEGRSYLTITEKQAQELVNKYAGTGRKVRSKSGEWQKKEKIVLNYDIGRFISSYDGTNVSTNAFMIVYAKDGTHIIPARRE